MQKNVCIVWLIAVTWASLIFWPAGQVLADPDFMNQTPEQSQELALSSTLEAAEKAFKTAQPAPAQPAMAPRAVEEAQYRALEAFAGAQVSWSSQTGAPNRIVGLRAPSQGEPADAAIAFLGRIKDAYRMRDPKAEFAGMRLLVDQNGAAHVKLRQLHQGVEVMGGELIVHFDPERRITEINGEYVPGLAEAVPVLHTELLAEEVLSIGYATFGTKPNLRVEEFPRLVVFPTLPLPRLAYRFVMSYDDGNGDVGRWIFVIDAVTAEILDKHNDIKFVLPPTKNGVIENVTGTRLAGEDGSSRTVLGWKDTTYNIVYLYDTTNKWYVYNQALSGYPDNATYAYRQNESWSGSDPLEISLAQNFTSVQFMFSTLFQRQSFDNKGANAVANAHYGDKYIGAFWNGAQFFFGDGDGAKAAGAGALDLVAHEYTHAVIQNSANLTYQNESGALNESLCDIFAVIAEFYTQPDDSSSYPSTSPGKADWLIGEDHWLANKAMRDLRNPSNPDTVGAGREMPSRYRGRFWAFTSEDNGGVHTNGGSHSFMFYLLSQGGSGVNDGLSYNVTGIGLDNARNVAYRALTRYMTAGSTYSTARTAWISAAKDLNSSWVASVRAAFKAIGVNGPVSVKQPDILWRQPSTGRTVVYQMNNATRTANAALPTLAGAWIIGAVADLNGDGKDDILWRNTSTGANLIWYMNGATQAGTATLPAINLPWVIVGVGDFYGDKKIEILWRNPTNGRNALMALSGATVTGITFIDDVPTNWTAIGVKDFDKDGKADIFWRNPGSGRNTIMYMNGSLKKSLADLERVQAPWSLVGFGDFSQSGYQDLLWYNPSTGRSVIWYMNGVQRTDYAILSDVVPGSWGWEIQGVGVFH